MYIRYKRGKVSWLAACRTSRHQIWSRKPSMAIRKYYYTKHATVTCLIVAYLSCFVSECEYLWALAHAFTVSDHQMEIQLFPLFIGFVYITIRKFCVHALSWIYWLTFGNRCILTVYRDMNFCWWSKLGYKFINEHLTFI